MATVYKTGNRVSRITVTTNLSLSAGTIPSWVNGSDTLDSSNSFFPVAISDNTGKFIQFDFPNPVKIDEATSRQGPTTVASASRGNWKWQLWDGTVWVDVGTVFALGGLASQVHTTLSGNVTYATKYRLLGTGGSVSDSGWMTEIEFREEDLASSVVAYADPLNFETGYSLFAFYRKPGTNQLLPLDIYPSNTVSPAYRETIRSQVISCLAGDVLEATQTWGTTNDTGQASEMAGMILLRKATDTGSVSINNAGPAQDYRCMSENSGTNILPSVHHHPLEWHGITKVLTAGDYVVSGMHYTSWGYISQSGNVNLQDGDLIIRHWRKI